MISKWFPCMHFNNIKMLPSKDEMIPNKGTISYDSEATKQVTNHKLNLCVGEYYDVLCVVYGLKPLAVLDGSDIGKEKHATYYDTSLINDIIKLCNANDIWCIHNQSTRTRIYAKTIFFHKDNYKNAVKLMATIFYDYATFDSYHYIIGKLLGYSLENIKAYFAHNKLNQPSEEDILTMDKEIDEMNVTIEDLDSQYPGELIIIKEISLFDEYYQ